MAESPNCQGHQKREQRRDKIDKLAESPMDTPDENCRILIKKGPGSVEASLKELEEAYESTPEWKMVKDGGVLSVPAEELRMENPPKPDRSGQVVFKRGGGGNQIEHYNVVQTVSYLNEEIRVKHEEEKQKATAAGMSESEAAKEASAAAVKLPQYQAVRAWQDRSVEITLKKALEKMMGSLGIPAVLIRSMNLKKMSALKDLGLRLPFGAEIDLVMAYNSGDLLCVNVFEVKRRSTYPWDNRSEPPTKQAVNKAEDQLTKDVDIIMELLRGISPDQIVVRSLACYPDSSSAELQKILCPDCLEQGVVGQEDLNDMSLLQKKTKVPEKPVPATTIGQQYLLKFTARCLSDQSLLHVGNRSIADKDNLASERHKFNLEAVDRRMMHGEYIVASPQQQKVIASFNSSRHQRHLVLTGAAGTGKTLVAVQVANNLIGDLEAAAEPGKEPLLLVTTERGWKEAPISKYLDANTSFAKNKTFKPWKFILKEYGVPESEAEMQLGALCTAVSHKWEGRAAVLLMDEVFHPDKVLASLADHCESLPDNATIIAVVNPAGCRLLPTLAESVLQVDLTTQYRSTRAITSLARFLAKRKGQDVPEREFGSDVEGKKPIFFDVGPDDEKLRQALLRSREQLGDDVTLFNFGGRARGGGADLPSSMKDICGAMIKDKGGPWEFYNSLNCTGWEANRVVVVTCGTIGVLEMITRAKTHLNLILAKPKKENAIKYYEFLQNDLEKAADEGLVERGSINC